jgi:hypothetical protein
MFKAMDVRFYSGSRVEERPVSIIEGTNERKVVEIVEQFLVEDSTSGERRRSFKVRTEDGGLYAVLESGDGWVVRAVRS